MKSVSVNVLSCAAIVVILSGIALADEHVKLTNGPADPSALGSIDYKHDRNGNTAMKLKADHLAPAANLQPPKQEYVVWIQAPGKPPENQGMLRVNSNEQGSIDITTPYKSFDVFVTAEDNPNASVPSGVEVLRGAVQAK